MKAGWVTKRLGDIGRTQYGLSESMNQEGKGFKIFRMGEVQDGRLIDTGRMKFADISAQEFEAYRLRPGDVLFNRTNSFELVGKTGIFDLEGDYCFASYLVRLNLDRKRVLPGFLNYFMNSDGFQKCIKGKASKSINQANINASILSAELIRYPESLPEQQRIVAILDEAFKGISNAKANTEKNLQGAIELFESHINSVFTSPKKAWTQKTLGQVCHFRGGGTPSKAVEGFWQGNIPWVSPKDMKVEIVLDSIDHISKEAVDESATSLVPEGAILMVVRSGILARTVPIAVAGVPLTINQDIKALCPNNSIDSRFLYCLLESKMPLLREMVSRGATVHRLMTDQIRTISFSLPPKRDQAQIIEQIDSMRTEIQNLKSIYQQKMTALSELKQSLLHYAFNGDL